MTQDTGTPSGRTAGREPDLRLRTGPVVGFALLAPVAVAAALHLAGDGVSAAVSVLVLVLVVVVAAVSGMRSAGALAALSAGAWFDFFLTEPYLSFKVLSPDDIEVTVLLLAVGLAVTELALWGRRQQARSSQRSGYLAGVLQTADLVAIPDTPADLLVARVAGQITEVLGIDGCRFEPADHRRARTATTLHRDGSVTQHAAPVDVDRHGLPTDDLTALPVEHGGVGYGRFLLTSSTRHARPTTEQRRIAVTLADQVGARLALGGAVPSPRASGD